MKAIAIVFAVMAAACHTTASSTEHVRSASAENAAFSRYRTFAFRLAEQPPPPYAVSARSFEVERRVRQLVASELVHKGYTEARENPDFLIALSSGTATQLEPEVGDPYVASSPNAVTTGAIVLDVFDSSTAQQVWRGTAEAKIDPVRINDAMVVEAVRKLLERFPTRSTADSGGVTNPQPE